LTNFFKSISKYKFFRVGYYIMPKQKFKKPKQRIPMMYWSDSDSEDEYDVAPASAVPSTPPPSARAHKSILDKKEEKEEKETERLTSATSATSSATLLSPATGAMLGAGSFLTPVAEKSSSPDLESLVMYSVKAERAKAETLKFEEEETLTVEQMKKRLKAAHTDTLTSAGDSMLYFNTEIEGFDRQPKWKDLISTFVNGEGYKYYFTVDIPKLAISYKGFLKNAKMSKNSFFNTLGIKLKNHTKTQIDFFSEKKLKKVEQYECYKKGETESLDDPDKAEDTPNMANLYGTLKIGPITKFFPSKTTVTF